MEAEERERALKEKDVDGKQEMMEGMQNRRLKSVWV
jgi:hypothetical protein